MANNLFETYKNSMMPHGSHLYSTSACMYMETMCECPPSQHSLKHRTCVLHCCPNCPQINLPDQLSDIHHSSTSTSISFHIYHLIACYIVHGRLPLDEKEICSLCLQYTDNVSTTKLYIRKELIMMETYIDYFHTNLYIPSIQNLEFHLPHIRTIGTNPSGNTRCESFKICRENQYLSCCRYYAEILVASFAHQMQSEYYGGNQSVSIEGIALDKFSAPTLIETSSTPKECTHHTVFSFIFFSDDSKQYYATTISHRKCIITLFNQCIIMYAKLSTI